MLRIKPPSDRGQKGETMAKDTQLTFRITSELKEQATKVAKAQGRTIGNLITYLLMKEIEKAAEK